MTDKPYRTPYAPDALILENGTTPLEIRDFVRKRTLNPIEVSGVTVWNYNNHEVNMSALREIANDLHKDKYVIPFQASGVWGYMVRLLPERISRMEILAYRQDHGEYVPFPNYIRHSDSEEDEEFLIELMNELNDREE